VCVCVCVCVLPPHTHTHKHTHTNINPRCVLCDLFALRFGLLCWRVCECVADTSFWGFELASLFERLNSIIIDDDDDGSGGGEKTRKLRAIRSVPGFCRRRRYYSLASCLQAVFCLYVCLLTM